jgi:hypothetical protein
MDLIEYFKSIDFNELNRFITEKQEENIHLEFKTANFPNYNNLNKEYDKKNFSEVLSGFANSNGGIIVWGIKAKENEKKQDVAFQKKPIKQLTKFLNLLNRLEGQAVTPIVTGIIHEKIEIGNDEGFIKSYIPSSEYAPHMANYSNKHYYKRSGDSFYICEHYDIRDMFNRKLNANLELVVSESTNKYQSGNKMIYEKTISLVNTGRNLAKAPIMKVNINSPFVFHTYGWDGNGNIGLFKKRAISSNPQSSTYMGGQDIIVYPELEYEIDKILLEIPVDTKEVPELEISYFIAAENMGKQNNVIKVSM